MDYTMERTFIFYEQGTTMDYTPNYGLYYGLYPKELLWIILASRTFELTLNGSQLRDYLNVHLPAQPSYKHYFYKTEIKLRFSDTWSILDSLVYWTKLPLVWCFTK